MFMSASFTSVLIQFRKSRNDFSISVMKSINCFNISIRTPSVEAEFLANPLNISQKPRMVARRTPACSGNKSATVNFGPKSGGVDWGSL